MTRQGKSSASDRKQWTYKMDEHLVGVLREEHETEGKHPDGTWKHTALEHAAKVVFDNTGEEVSVEHVRGRRRYLQERYKKAKECKEKSGFGWEPSTQMFTADPIAWTEFVKENPKLKSYRTKPVPFFDDLECIFGEEKVTGLRNFEGSEAPSHVEPLHGDGIDIDNEVESGVNVPTTRSSSSTLVEKGKKKRKANEEMEEKLLMGMIDAAKEVAAALRPQECDVIEVALRQLPDMTEEDILDGMDLLGPDPQLTKLFFGISEVGMKKAWLRRRLHRRI